MHYHVVIGNFMGIWPLEKELEWWIQTRWKTKGEIELKLGLKGFFIAIFTSIEDKYYMFENGPYFFNSEGIYLHLWSKKIGLEKGIFHIFYSLGKDVLATK